MPQSKRQERNAQSENAQDKLSPRQNVTKDKLSPKQNTITSIKLQQYEILQLVLLGLATNLHSIQVSCRHLEIQELTIGNNVENEIWT